MAETSDKELWEFCQWYKHHYGKREDVESVFITCMCGHFHSYPKAMKEVVKRMADIGIIKKEKDRVTIL